MGVSMTSRRQLAVSRDQQGGALPSRKQTELVERRRPGRNTLGVQIAQELVNKGAGRRTLGPTSPRRRAAIERFYQDAEITVPTSTTSPRHAWWRSSSRRRTTSAAT